MSTRTIVTIALLALGIALTGYNAVTASGVNSRLERYRTLLAELDGMEQRAR